MPRSPSTRDRRQDFWTGSHQLPGLPGFAGKLIPMAEVRELYERVRSAPDGFRLETLLQEMRVDLQLPSADLERIPTKGPLVAVANHPFGILDGAALGVLLSRVRPDVRVMTNSLLEGIPELREHCFFVDPFQTAASAERNLKALKEAIAWLRQGGALAVFPSGEVSQFNVGQGQVDDPVWNTVAARLIRKTGAHALPVYFCGRNSVTFQLLGLIHPRLRTLVLMQEFLQQRGKKLEVRVGTPIPAELIAGIENDREATEYLRLRTYLLSYRGKKDISFPTKMRSVLPRKAQETIATTVPQSLLVRDIESLPPTQLLTESSEFAVYAARAAEMPHLLEERGRLREVTFRAAGEGTGKSTDLDQFDSYYWHLLLWSKERQELAGAYRAGNTDEIIRSHG